MKTNMTDLIDNELLNISGGVSDLYKVGELGSNLARATVNYMVSTTVKRYFSYRS